MSRFCEDLGELEWCSRSGLLSLIFSMLKNQNCSWFSCRNSLIVASCELKNCQLTSLENEQ